MKKLVHSIFDIDEGQINCHQGLPDGDSSIKLAIFVKSLKSRDLVQIIEQDNLTNSLLFGHVLTTMKFS